MEPTSLLAVTLQAQQWQAVLVALSDAPYRVVAPLIQEIQQQCLRQGDEVAVSGNGATAVQAETGP